MLRHTFYLLFLLFVSVKCFGGASVPYNVTYMLLEKDWTTKISQLNPTQVFITYSSNGGRTAYSSYSKFLRGDTILNLKGFLDSTRGSLIGYRLVYRNSRQEVDSLYQLDKLFRLEFKSYAGKPGLALIHTYDSLGRITDRFLFNYGKKFKLGGSGSFGSLTRENPLFEIYDRTAYSVGSVWIVSIGIDDYKTTQYKTCKSDAISYIDYFKRQLWSSIGSEIPDLFHGFLLLDKQATKDSIIKVLKYIIARATSNDYFIFNFSGSSRVLTLGESTLTFFDTYGVSLRGFSTKTDTIGHSNSLLSLKELQDLVQFIPSERQLYISEAGPSKKFKIEFIKTLIKNSPDVASVLNKNRVIMVPDSIGYEGLSCGKGFINKGPINYYITSLDSANNIYDLWEGSYKASKIAFQLKAKDYECKPIRDKEYFEVFFEKKFLEFYQDLLGDGEVTRGGRQSNQNLNKAAGLTGKKYALIVGTDNYSTKSWTKLNNPILDATAVAEELRYSYGFEVNLLRDPPLDSLYSALREYYQTLQEDDQLLVYFAGHGDFDEGLLDDGFIVCTNSKSATEDPIRNTYIQHTKLKKMINKIPAKQILVLLDVCHGGVFDENVLGAPMREDPNSSSVNLNVIQFLEEKSKYKSRRVLSSVGKEAAFDGRAGKHSPFANMLLQTLRGKGGQKGYITLANLYSVLQEASLGNDVELKISPHMARFGGDDPFGEFVLIPVANLPTNQN